MISNTPGDTVPPVSATRSGWASLPNPIPAASACWRHTASSVASLQDVSDCRGAIRPARAARAASSRTFAALLVHRKRTGPHVERGGLGELDQRPRPLLEPRHAVHEAPHALRVHRQADGREPRHDQLGKVVVRTLAQIVGVDAGELGEVEARRRPAHRGEVEQRHRLVGADDLLVAVAPAEPQEIVAHRLRQEPQFAILGHAQGAVPLAELGAVRAMDQRDMGEARRLAADRTVELDLAEGVGQVVVAANDMGDPHVDVVHHHREHVGRGAVGTQQDHVVELGVLDVDLALDQVGDPGGPRLGRLQPDHRRHAGRRVGRVAVAPAAVIARRQAVRPLLRPHLLEFLRARPAAIGLALGEQPVRHLGMPAGTLELEDGRLVRIEAEPGQAVEDGVDGALRGPLPVGVLDPQQEPAAMAAGEQPVEQRRSRPADVQITCGRRCEPNYDTHD